MATPVVELRHVSRRYTVGANTVVALDEATLAIHERDFIVVLGPSGSGKTTLLNLIGALDTPSSGEVAVAGRVTTGLGRAELARFRRETVSFVFQTFNLFPSLTARENVQFGADVAGRPDSAATAVAVLEQVGLAERADHFPHELSGGEQQRVAIARALATENPLLLADEPTGELDFKTGISILELLEEQAGAGRTVVVVTHNREIARAANRVIELSSGRVVSDGPPASGPVHIHDLHW